MNRKRTYAPASKNRMTMLEYQAAAQRTSPEDGHDKVDNALLGLLGECGEIADLYKKQCYQSKPDTPMPIEKYKEEIGDVLWYMAELAAGRREMMAGMLKGDFKDYDESAWKAGFLTDAGDMRKTIVSMCAKASDICQFVSEGDFERAKCHARRLVSAAARLATICRFTLEEAAICNVEKLKKRYPDGFDAGISEARYK